MTGEEFRKAIGEYTLVRDPTHDEYRIDFYDNQAFDQVKKKLKVIARATAEDKFILISGIKKRGGLIAMTGKNMSDVEAL